MRFLAAAALFLFAAAMAGAQVNTAGGAAPPTMSSWGRGFARSFGHGPHSYGFGNAFLAEPWPASYPEPATPSVIVLQGAPPASPSPRVMEEIKPIEPLTIEWQGDHYARLSEAETSARRVAPVDYAGPRAAPPKNAVEAPTVLVYRDGHQEKIAAYSIIGPVLYASDDFYTNGSWTRKIALSALDLPATIKANRAAGVKFELPSGPNEVIARF